MVASLRLDERTARGYHPDDVPVVHPCDALKWPCISIQQAAKIATLYGRRAMASQGFAVDKESTCKGEREVVTVSRNSVINQQESVHRKLRLGYLSPDLTSKHPMAFLIQHVFQHHKAFLVHILQSLCFWPGWLWISCNNRAVFHGGGLGIGIVLGRRIPRFWPRVAGRWCCNWLLLNYYDLTCSAVGVGLMYLDRQHRVSGRALDCLIWGHACDLCFGNIYTI